MEAYLLENNGALTFRLSWSQKWANSSEMENNVVKNVFKIRCSDKVIIFVFLYFNFLIFKK